LYGTHTDREETQKISGGKKGRTGKRKVSNQELFTYPLNSTIEEGKESNGGYKGTD